MKSKSSHRYKRTIQEKLHPNSGTVSSYIHTKNHGEMIKELGFTNPMFLIRNKNGIAPR